MSLDSPKYGDSLTKSELRVYDLIVNFACCDKKIAKIINRSVRTAKFHKRSIFKKKGVNTSLELVVIHYKLNMEKAA